MYINGFTKLLLSKLLSKSKTKWVINQKFIQRKHIFWVWLWSILSKLTLTESSLKAKSFLSQTVLFCFHFLSFLTSFVLTNLSAFALTDSKFSLILLKEILEYLSWEIFTTWQHMTLRNVVKTLKLKLTLGMLWQGSWAHRDSFLF